MNTHPHPHPFENDETNAAPEIVPAGERLMAVVDVAEYLNVTVPGVYLAIKAGRIPSPYYPLSRSPRWRRSEIDEALARTRTSPAQARAERRQKHLEKLAR